LVIAGVNDEVLPELFTGADFELAPEAPVASTDVDMTTTGAPMEVTI